jgi:hypothetical protein
MVLIIQLLKLVQESLKMAADQILNLTVTPKPADAVTTNNLFWGISWNGTDYTQEAGKIAKDGCTADQVLNLTVTPKPADAVATQTICSESFSWNGTDYTTTQLVQESLKMVLLINLNLTVTPKPADAVTTNNLFWRVFLLEWY